MDAYRFEPALIHMCTSRRGHFCPSTSFPACKPIHRLSRSIAGHTIKKVTCVDMYVHFDGGQLTTCNANDPIRKPVVVKFSPCSMITKAYLEVPKRPVNSTFECVMPFADKVIPSCPGLFIETFRLVTELHSLYGFPRISESAVTSGGSRNWEGGGGTGEGVARGGAK